MRSESARPIARKLARQITPKDVSLALMPPSSVSIGLSGTLKRLLTLCLLLAGGDLVMSQTIVNSLSRNGELTWSGTSTGDVVCVQWAPTIAGPWFSSWDELCS